MKLKVVDYNFLNTKDWIFKFENERKKVVFVMDDPFYKNAGLKSPLTKQHSDTYVAGMFIEADVENINDKNVVTKITKFLIQ